MMSECTNCIHQCVCAGYEVTRADNCQYHAKITEYQPVRRGRWVIEGEEYRNMTVSCTCCDYVRHIFGWGLPDLKRDLKVNYPYCNKCGGGKMDEVVVKNGKH